MTKEELADFLGDNWLDNGTIIMICLAVFISTAFYFNSSKEQETDKSNCYCHCSSVGK